MAYSRPFPVNPTLSAISIGYRNPATYYVADDVMPRQPVPNSAFKWMKYDTGQHFTVPRTEVGRRGTVNRVEFSGTLIDDAVRDYGLEDSVPVTDIDDATAMRNAGLGTFDPLDAATEGLTDLMLIDRELRVASVVQNPSNYAANRRLVLSGTDQFSDYTNSNPISVIKAAMSSTLIFRPNLAVMSRAVWDGISSHPKLVNAVKGNVTGSGIITTDDFAKLFSLNKVSVGEAFANTARKGQVPALSRIWGPHLALLYVNPAIRPDNGMTWGLTAIFGDRFAGDWFDKDVGLQGAQVVRVGERMKEVVTAPDVGYLIQNVIQG